MIATKLDNTKAAIEILNHTESVKVASPFQVNVMDDAKRMQWLHMPEAASPDIDDKTSREDALIF